MAFLLRVIFSVRFIAAGNLQHAVSDEVLTRSVALNNCLDDIFRNICIVGKQLLRILRQAVAAIAKARVIVVATNARVKAHAVNNLLRVQALHLCVGIQLVEVGNTQCQIGIAE